jgi:hypothetical protein
MLPDTNHQRAFDLYGFAGDLTAIAKVARSREDAILIRLLARAARDAGATPAQLHAALGNVKAVLVARGVSLGEAIDELATEMSVGAAYRGGAT